MGGAKLRRSRRPELLRVRRVRAGRCGDRLLPLAVPPHSPFSRRVPPTPAGPRRLLDPERVPDRGAHRDRAHGWPVVATNGFHTQAGWLAFNAIVLGLSFSAVPRPSFTDQSGGNTRPERGPNPAAPLLVPLLVLVGSRW